MADPTGTSSEILAERLFKYLVGELNSQLPQVDLFDPTHSVPWDKDSTVLKPVEKVTLAELRTAFDELMASFDVHLKREAEGGRIIGAEYTKTYIALTQSAMATALQFVLSKDQAFWLSAKTQADAVAANNQNEVIRFNAKLALAQYALTKLELANKDSTFGLSELQRTDVLPQQVLLTQEQRKMVTEQAEAQRAQTADVRLSDNEPVSGLIGKQKDLYAQQKVSYQDDTKIKATRVFSELWVTQKTIDEGTLRSSYFSPAAMSSVFKQLRFTAGVPTDDPFVPEQDTEPTS